MMTMRGEKERGVVVYQAGVPWLLLTEPIVAFFV